MKKSEKKWLAGLLALALVLGGAQSFPGARAKAAGSGENLIKNPNFAESDLSAWMNTGATITAESQEQEILAGVKTYATISGRTQTYQGFSQDVTDVAKPGKEYELSFYVKLSEDFDGLAGDKRQVFFGPYVVVGGQTQYLRQTYSGDITGELNKEIPVGKWVQLSGNYKIAEGATQVVLRFQQEDDPGMGSYSITGVSMREIGEGPLATPTPQPPMDDGLPRLKDAITAALGEDTIVGMVTHPLNNKKEWQLLQRHANAMTTGNELKPDFLFSYSCDNCPGTETITFNGKSLLVPKITNFSAIDAYLNEVLKHNEAYPEDKIRVRGHVLVWHAQTPEWFFHEEYDPKKPYVTKEEMDRRLEWYISAVFGHFLGEGSKYRDLFYGWDVVNEACWDGAKTYRDDTVGNDKLTDSRHDTKSSWWHVYQSNEFIINAFKYANKYAPASVELYYNDYGETSPTKMQCICELLRAVKEQEGAPGVGTRINAFGMQGHYGLNDFNIQNFETAAKAYMDIVGKIQITELDLAASSRYDGTDATKDQEYQDQALCYQRIFETLKKLDAMDGYEVGGITFWGVTDPYSWLQSRSNLGGGQDGTQTQCPLLFDGNYEAKPAFWAFVDPSKIPVTQKQVVVCRTYNAKTTNARQYSFSGGNTSATLLPIWDEKGLTLQVEVMDSRPDKDMDYVIFYLDEQDGKGITQVKKSRDECSSMSGGYRASVTFPLSEIHIGKEVLFDIVVRNKDDLFSYNDFRGKQEQTSDGYASATLKTSLTKVFEGSPAVDGEKDEVWNTAENFWLNVVEGDTAASAKVKVLWDAQKLYLYAEICDSEVGAEDALEIYLNEDNVRSSKYAKDDKYYRITGENQVTCQGKEAKEKNVQSAVKKTDDGYVIEASIEWPGAAPKAFKQMGFDLKVYDADASGKKIGTLSWNDTTGEAQSVPAVFGSIKLEKAGEAKEEQADPDAQFSLRSVPAAVGEKRPEASLEESGAKESAEPAPAQPGGEEPSGQSAKRFPWYAVVILLVIVAGGAALGILSGKKGESKPVGAAGKQNKGKPENETKKQDGGNPENKSEEQDGSNPEREVKEQDGDSPEGEAKEQNGDNPEGEDKEQDGSKPENETKE